MALSSQHDDSATRPTFIIHHLDHGRAAAHAAQTRSCAVLLMSAPGASHTLGILGFHALATRIKDEFPALTADFVLDCADGAGHVLGALRAGIRAVRYDGPAVDRLREIAGTYRAILIQEPRIIFDLLDRPDPYAAAYDWLGSVDGPVPPDLASDPTAW